MKYLYPIVLSLFLNSTAQGQTIVMVPADKDNTIYSENNAQSNGQSQYLFAGRTGVNAGNARRRALIHFNLDAIPPGATITNVSLALFCNNVSGAGVNASINVHKVSNDWGEGASGSANSGGNGSPAVTGDATWANRFFNTSLWATAGGDFAATISGTAAVNQTGALAISTSTLIADVQGWLANSAGNFGWEIVGSSEGTSNTARRFGSRENATASERPQLTITYTGGLPVTLKSFTTALRQQNALLEWTTSTEINNDYFNIEHSLDGRHYTIEGKVKGAGNSTVEHKYSFVHKTVTAGKNFYRLAQYDLNGDVKYSSVVTLNKTSSFSIETAPNPATSSLILTSDEPLKGKSFLIRSAIGEVVQKGILSNLPLNIAHLTGGMYFISVQGVDQRMQTTVFIKD
jgi:hypothetical protein